MSYSVTKTKKMENSKKKLLKVFGLMNLFVREVKC